MITKHIFVICYLYVGGILTLLLRLTRIRFLEDERAKCPVCQKLTTQNSPSSVYHIGLCASWTPILCPLLHFPPGLHNPLHKTSFYREKISGNLDVRLSTAGPIRQLRKLAQFFSSVHDVCDLEVSVEHYFYHLLHRLL